MRARGRGRRTPGIGAELRQYRRRRSAHCDAQLARAARDRWKRSRRASLARASALRVIRLIPGILTDHVALAAAGWATVTLSRGSMRTLQRIHTTRDTLATMRGTGIAGAARVLATTAMELS